MQVEAGGGRRMGAQCNVVYACFPTVLASCKAVSSAYVCMFYLKIGSDSKKIPHIIRKQNKNLELSCVYYVHEHDHFELSALAPFVSFALSDGPCSI